MTEQHTPEFEAFCDEHGFDYTSVYPEDQQEVKAAWTAWQAVRATPADPYAEYRRGVREAFNAANMINANRQGRNDKETCSYIVRSLAELANGSSATPADQVPVAWRAVNCSGFGDEWAYRDADDRFVDNLGNLVGEPLYAAPQPPQNAADHIEAQSVRDAWISEVKNDRD